MNAAARGATQRFSGAGSAAGLATLLALTACGSAPPVAPPAARVEVAVAAPELPVVLPRQSTFERSQRDRALLFTQQRRLADAAIAWEVLALLRPDVDLYRERLLETRQQIEARVAERLSQAALLLKRGQGDDAFQQYLAVLALQPNHPAAADALRGMELDRNARQHLGKLSRNTLTRSVIAQSEASASDRRASATAAASGAEFNTEISADASTGDASRSGTTNDVEHAALLAGDGEMHEAIELLEARLAVERRDAAARRLLASLYYRQAESLAISDRHAAIEALRKSLRLDPAEPRTPVLMKKLAWAAVAPHVPSTDPKAAPKRDGKSSPSR